jgi:hypothetical protein
MASRNSRRRIMAAAEIDRSRWAPFPDTVTSSLVGKQVEIDSTIEIVGADGTRQIVWFKDSLAPLAPAENAPGVAAR